MKLGDAPGEQESPVRPNVRRVEPDVDERGGGAKYTGDLPGHSPEVIDVRVRPEGDSSIEALVGEGQLSCVRLYDFASFTSEPEHVRGDIHADDLPSELAERRPVSARSAPYVEQATGLPAEEPSGSRATRIVDLAEEIMVVPLRDPV